MKTEDVVMKAIAVLAPTPTAWLVGQSTFALMNFPLPVSIAAALTVEGLGFVAVNTVTEMIEFNRHINTVEASQKMQAPVKQAIGVVGLYVATAIIMTVILHIAPAWIPFAPLPFIAMMVSVGWMYALRKDHSARVEKWGTGRAQAKAKRMKPAKAKPKPATASFACGVAGCKAKPFGSQAALNAHQRKHKQIAGYNVSFEPVMTAEAQAQQAQRKGER